MSDQNRSLSEIATTTNIAPSVAVLACGGGGINMVRAALGQFGGRASYCFLDTSHANVQAEEDVHVISGGGSGMVRRHNSEPIQEKILHLTDSEIGLADINIVVFSSAGGSGSVIGPLLIRDIATRRNRLVIAMTIASTQSQVHTTNTLNTLKSLVSITSENNIYLPISIFDNTVGVKLVDQVMPTKLARLVDILTLPTREVDRNDRLHWIDAQKTISAPPGLRLLHVTCDEGTTTADTSCEIWPGFANYIFDSVLTLHTDRYVVNQQPKARVVYDGLFSTVRLVPMMGVIGNPPNAFDKLIKDISDILTSYTAQQHKPMYAITVAPGEVDGGSGLVL